METILQLLITLGVAVLIFIAIFWRRTAYACPSPILPRIKVGDHVVARSMLIDHADAFSNRELSTFPVDFNAGRSYNSYSITTVPYGPLWRALRCNLTADVFHPSRLGRLGHLQREAVQALVADLSTRCPADGKEAVVVVRDRLHSAMFPLIVRLCFGDGVDVHHTCAMQNALQEFFNELVAARALAASRLARLMHWRRWLRFAGTFNRLIKLFVPLIEARRRCHQSNRGDIIRPYVDSLLELQVPADNNNDTISMPGVRRGLRDDEISALVWEFLGAGSWTVVASIEWTLAYLVIKPEVQLKLYHEIAACNDGDSVLSEERLRRFPYLRAVMLESLRLHSSVPFIIRDAAGTEGAKASVAQGALSACPLVNFVVSARDIGRNRDAWTDPDEFIPERFLAGGEGEHVSPIPGSKEIKMMPFGAGRRSCPGAGVALLHGKMFLAALVREFEWAPLADGVSGVDLKEANGFFKVMKKPLRVRITPRKH